MANTGIPPLPPPLTTIDPIIYLNTSISPKLNEINYLTWKAQVLPLINGYNLTKHISSSSPPIGVTDAEQEQWNRQDQFILGWLRSSLTDTLQGQMVSCSSACELWSAIQQTFSASSRARLSDLKRQLQTATKGASSCKEYLNRMRKIADELSFIGSSVSDEELVMATLNGLGPDFNSFTVVITTRNDPISFAEFQGMLFNHENLLLNQNLLPQVSSNLISNPSALYARYPQPGNKHNQYRPSRPYFDQNRAILPTPGPRPIYAPTVTTPSQNQPRGPRPNQPRGSRPQQTNGAKPTCQVCTKVGHVARFCWYRYDPDPAYPHPIPSASASSPQAYIAQPSHVVGSTSEWILDSGATNHVTNDINNLSSFYNYDGADVLQIGNGAGLEIQNIGSSSISLSSTFVLLKDILHVPKFTKNLLSLSRLILDNPHLLIEFSSSLCIIKDLRTSAILLKVPCHRGLFLLSLPPTSPVLALVGIRVPASVWHARFCHTNHATTLHLLNSNNLPCISHKLPLCHSCCMAKAHQLPFSTSSSTSTSPLELVHSDVWGPSPVTSWNGYRYYIVFVDDFSKFTWIYFMATKGEVLSIFTRFKNQVENLLSTTIKTLRTDGGTEYKPIHTRFPHLVHQTSCPYTPQQNGVSERKHRHIVELAIASMTHASIPSTYWDDIFSSIVFTINRLPSHNATVPYTSLFHASPDYTFLRVLGCLCFPLTRPYSEHKLQTRSLPCVFIGYATSQKGYRCLHLSSNKIFISRNVIFDEAVFPFQQSSTHKMVSPATSLLSVSHTPPVGPLPFSAETLHSLQPNINNSPTTDFHSSPQPNFIHPSSQPTLSPYGLPPLLNSSSPTSSRPDPLSPSSSSPVSDPLEFSSPLTPDNPTVASSSTHQSSSIHPMVTRTRDHTRRPRQFPDHVAYLASLDSEPTSFSAANAVPEWRQAMAVEIDALAMNNTWTLVEPPTNQHIVGCKWVYKLKRRSDGSVERHKARLVAKGFHQIEGVDFLDTFSPVVRPTSIRVILSLAVSFQWPIHQLDVQNAFLHGDLAETVYMSQPPGFVDSSRPNHVCLLSKSLYGLKQSPRAWFHKLTSALLEFGFVASSYDPSLFVHHSKGQTTVLLVYVDDILLTGSNSAFLTSCLGFLQQRFAIKNLGNLHYFLGVQVSPTPTGLHLSQTKYITDLLTRTNMQSCKPCSTPMATSPPLSKLDSPFFTDTHLYRSVVGALQYATITRPDISFAVNKVSQFMQQPTIAHWTATKRILRYLCGTISYGLSFRASHSLTIDAYSDADWAGSVDDRRSTSGYCIFLGNNLVSWSAKKQPTVSRSSTEAEYRSLALTCAELLWLQYLLIELRVPLAAPPVLWCDNIGATFLASNPMFHSRTKHVEIDFHFVREKVVAHEILVRFLCSQDQLADSMTKPLPTTRFQFLRTKLQVTESPSACGGGNNAVLDDFSPST
jgi:Reverse transcriptase (RNA-dependent DNA polymerase)/gag-polypeptide of LTR copia-type